jgi:hypothetical protein
MKWVCINMGCFPRSMHQFVRIPVDKGLMAKESSVGGNEAQREILTKWKEMGSGSSRNEGLTREQIIQGFANVGLWCWTLAFIVCVPSFICYLVAAGGDVKDSKKKEIDKACGAELFQTVYDHFVLHIFSFLFICFVVNFIFSFKNKEESELQKNMPLSWMMIPVVFCLGYIIAFAYMAARMEGRFQEASKNEKCMNAVHGFGRWGEAYRLDVLRNMYLVADVLWCVCYFFLLCAACLMGAYSREW